MFLLQGEMLLPNNYYHIRYLSYRESQEEYLIDVLCNILPWTTFQDLQDQPALGINASICWFCEIQHAIQPGDAIEW
jgi:hypothetical protein